MKTKSSGSTGFGSVLLHKLNEWEVRLTPMNKVFVVNTERDQTQWPYLDKKGTVKFEVVHSGKRANDPPQAIQDTVKRVLLSKRNIRLRHNEDFTETENQYVFS